MTERDTFAMAALQGICMNEQAVFSVEYLEYAREAYLFADAMMIARKEPANKMETK